MAHVSFTRTDGTRETREFVYARYGQDVVREAREFFAALKDDVTVAGAALHSGIANDVQTFRK